MAEPGTTQSDHYDLIVVGSGSGNAIPEEMGDWRIALVERGVFGGTCLNVGCIPSKMFVLPADVAESAKAGPALGVNTSFQDADWPAIRDRVFGRIDPISEGGERYRASECENIELIRGTARFTGDRTFVVEGIEGVNGQERHISADRVLVASGARPSMPPIEGLAEVRTHTSDSVMRLDSLPERLGIIGGGFIAVELGHVFSGYGSNVTMFVRSGALVRQEDQEISEAFTQLFADRVDLRLNEVPNRVEQRGDVIVCHTDNGQYEVDELLVASGRTPNSDLIDAEAGGLTLHPDGRVVVDATMATGVEGVWAVGDMANRYQLKHLANAEAKVAFWNMMHPDDPKEVDYRAVPHAACHKPQLAGKGRSNQDSVDSAVVFMSSSRRLYSLLFVVY